MSASQPRDIRGSSTWVLDTRQLWQYFPLDFRTTYQKVNVAKYLFFYFQVHVEVTQMNSSGNPTLVLLLHP